MSSATGTASGTQISDANVEHGTFQVTTTVSLKCKGRNFETQAEIVLHREVFIRDLVW